MFVCANRDGVLTPVGTAFLVGIQSDNGEWFRYFVTAGHIVRDDEPRWVRLRRQDGGAPEDHAVEDWVHHPTSDLAAARCDLDTEGLVANFQEDVFFCDVYPLGMGTELGGRAYFMGLLSSVETMAERAIPMMRAAVVGAMNVEDVPVHATYPDGTAYDRTEPKAHLIDTYSRSGFSGAPVYVEHLVLSAKFDLHAVEATGVTVSAPSPSALFGVLVGHFGSLGDNAGVGIVIPIDALRELLDDQHLAAPRE